VRVCVWCGSLWLCVQSVFVCAGLCVVVCAGLCVCLRVQVCLWWCVWVSVCAGHVHGAAVWNLDRQPAQSEQVGVGVGVRPVAGSSARSLGVRDGRPVPVELMSQAWCEHGPSRAGMDWPACSGLLPAGRGEKGLVDGPGALTEALSPSVWLMERPCGELTGRQGDAQPGLGESICFFLFPPSRSFGEGSPQRQTRVLLLLVSVGNARLRFPRVVSAHAEGFWL